MEVGAAQGEGDAAGGEGEEREVAGEEEDSVVEEDWEAGAVLEEARDWAVGAKVWCTGSYPPPHPPEGCFRCRAARRTPA